MPIFLLSSVTGESLDLLRHFLFKLKPMKAWDTLLRQPAEFVLDNTYNVTGVGTVRPSSSSSSFSFSSHPVRAGS